MRHDRKAHWMWLLLLLPACGSRHLDSFNDGSQSSNDRSSLSPDSNGNERKPPFDPKCALPGTTHPINSVAEEESYIVGRWILCEGIQKYRPEMAGIEFLPDKRLFFLIFNESGTIVRGNDFKYEATWEVEKRDVPGDFYDLRIRSADGGGDSCQPAFRENPRKMLLGLAYTHQTFVDVPSGE
jgi:hypothetical protein